MPKHRRIHTYVGFVIVWIVFLTSCGSSTLVTDDICAVPCWKGITPGKTTKNDLDHILPSIPEIDQDSIFYESYPEERFFWRFNSSVDDFSGHISLSEGTVRLIKVRPNNRALTLDEAIKKLGNPEQVLAVANPLAIYLQNLTKGYIIMIDFGYIKVREEIHLDENDYVFIVYYFDPKMVDGLYTSDLFGFNPEFVDDEIRPWNGYGEIHYAFYR